MTHDEARVEYLTQLEKYKAPIETIFEELADALIVHVVVKHRAHTHSWDYALNPATIIPKDHAALDWHRARGTFELCTVQR